MSDAQSIKYRLIGAAVIVVSFVLAWWLLLDHDVKRHQNLDMQMPEPITVERFDIDSPVVPADEVKAQEVVAVTVGDAATATSPEPEPVIEKPKVASPKQTLVADSKPEAKPVEKPSAKALAKLDSDGLPEAWVLQLGSFQEKQNAQALQKKLLDNDFPAYVKAFNLPSGRIYRVLIGPKLNKDKAAQMAAQVQKKLGLKSILVPFKPGFEE